VPLQCLNKLLPEALLHTVLRTIASTKQE